MDQGDNSEPSTLPWVIEIENCLNQRLPPDAESQRTIHRVPSNLREVDKNAFSPEMIGIGPLNNMPREGEGSSSRLLFMEGHKLRFLNRLLEGNLGQPFKRRLIMRTEGIGKRDQIGKAVLLDGLERAISTLKQEIMAHYSVNFANMSRPDFVRKMVVDGCFVVELFRIHYGIRHHRLIPSAFSDDPIVMTPRILTTLRRDLLLLENQLPFCVLEKLYEVIHQNNTDHDEAVPLEVVAVTFFGPSLPRSHAAPELADGKPYTHLLDLFRSTFLRSRIEILRQRIPIKYRLRCSSKLQFYYNRSMVLHYASELDEAGVRFKKRKDHDFLDIKFRHHTLRVPPLSLNDNIISLLLNIVAYELSINHPEPFFTNYLTFWYSLVNSPRDIQVLHKHGIINNMGNEEDMANLFMRCREAINNPDLGYLCGEIEGVNEYCERYYESKYRVWWRTLIREHFSSPWTCLSLFAAIILLLLTLLQTIYTAHS